MFKGLFEQLDEKHFIPLGRLWQRLSWETKEARLGREAYQANRATRWRYTSRIRGRLRAWRDFTVPMALGGDEEKTGSLICI